jgi:hypothetical protein
MHAWKLTAIAGIIGIAGVLVYAGDEPSAASSAVKEATPVERVQSLSFLAGAWRGEMGGSLVEEVWSQPHGSSIMGCFRWCKPDGTPSMFEILTITAEGEDVLLRLRHYSPKLVAKEEADKPLTLALREITARRAVFGAQSAGDLSSVTYEVKPDEHGTDRLHIEVAFIQGEKPRQPLVFTLSK